MTKTKTLLAAAALLAATACEITEVNVNPNSPVDVPMSTLLPPAQRAIGEFLAQDAAIISGVFVQHYKGTQVHALPIEKYIIDDAFLIDPIWADLYTGPLNVLSQLVRKAEDNGSPHYAGLARVLLAHSLATASDLWGDLPFEDAFQGSENLNPAYQAQERIYEIAQQQLSLALDELAEPQSVFSPGADDVIYQGDLEAWTRAAHSLKARLHLHLTRRDPQAAQSALAHAALGFRDSDDDLLYQFGFTPAEQNPYFLYFQNTPYVNVDPDFIAKLDALADPRKSRMLKITFGSYTLGPAFASLASPVALMGYDELKFIEAEARLRTGDTPGAQQALQQAIVASVLKITDGATSAADAQAFAERVGTLQGDQQADLATLMLQKHIALFTQIEAWTDYRRTGLPALQPNPDGDNPQNPGGAIPRRLPYPQNERFYNASFPGTGTNMQERVWWDQP